jgi:hypothetical protein
MRSRLGDSARLNHILDAISEIETYLQNADFEMFLKQSMMRFACSKQFEDKKNAAIHGQFKKDELFQEGTFPSCRL